ncbi:U-actitoxin-Avd8a [Exaiptasia diaphana]|uniref:Uncharacterized protein n=1 Tax=Exaiptasia diaphana TaxID=2652724 RepID=A0A913XTS9_EXADI|nr:U-actitoxin-Avd8a [Exaiptasia diaphana]KXJ29404.1 hypothetical protein AC249_AIPGENE27020 [Exaiptasia diaphana]
MKYFIALLVVAIGVAVVCAEHEELYELVREIAQDSPRFHAKRCINKFKSNICGGLVTQESCARSDSRMGKFALKFCRFMCGNC